MVADALSVLACGTGHGIDMGNSGIYRKRRSSRNPDRRHTSRPVERDPSKADDSIPGSDPVSGKSSRLADSWNLGELSGAYRWMAGGKSRASGRRISGFRSAGDITFSYFCSCGTGRIPSCTGTGAAGANLMGGCSMAGRDLAVAGCSSKQSLSGDGAGRSTSGNNRV